MINKNIFNICNVFYISQSYSTIFKINNFNIFIFNTKIININILIS